MTDQREVGLARHARRLAAAAICSIALAGCGQSSDTVSTTAGSEAATAGGTATVSAAASASVARAQARGGYIDYATYAASPASYATGRVVLFFHADWCPSCRETDKNLRANPAAIPSDLTIVEVDYDTATELKAKYGVTHQHTFVSIAADGAKKRIWSGTFTAAQLAAKA